MAKRGRPTLSPAERLIKTIGQETYDKIANADAEELKALIASTESEVRDAEIELKENEKIKEARQAVADLAGPFQDAKKRGRAIQRACREYLDAKGK